MITPEHHPQHEEEQRTAWEAQEPVITILEQQGAQALFDRIKDADDAFTEHKERLCCIDEGTAHQEGPSRWCLAGSGILYPAASWDERLARVADLCIELGITEVTNHEGCGAAKLAWHEADEPGASSDAYGRRWSEALAAAIAQKTSAGAVHHREISLDEMARPRSFHDARVVWFDATGAFEPGALGTNIPK